MEEGSAGAPFASKARGRPAETPVARVRGSPAVQGVSPLREQDHEAGATDEREQPARPEGLSPLARQHGRKLWGDSLAQASVAFALAAFVLRAFSRFRQCQATAVEAEAAGRRLRTTPSVGLHDSRRSRQTSAGSRLRVRQALAPD